jgi:hypothetical protein
VFAELLLSDLCVSRQEFEPAPRTFLCRRYVITLGSACCIEVARVFLVNLRFGFLYRGCCTTFLTFLVHAKRNSSFSEYSNSCILKHVAAVLCEVKLGLWDEISSEFLQN